MKKGERQILLNENLVILETESTEKQTKKYGLAVIFG
jgi:hypothetical protein